MQMLGVYGTGFFLMILVSGLLLVVETLTRSVRLEEAVLLGHEVVDLAEHGVVIHGRER